MTQLIEPFGFEVQEANNGREAIALWESWHPHLIWMDMRMPVMDGYEATRQIRLRESTSNDVPLSSTGTDAINRVRTTPLLSHSPTKIIALTASAFEEERGVVLGAGCDDLVRKPFRANTIWEKLAEHLGVEFLYSEELFPVVTDSSVQSTPLYSALLSSYRAKAALTPERLQVMSPEWVDSLHQAAVSGDDTLALSLVAEIPKAHADLAIALTQLIDDFRLDTISDLTER
jgi:CheY-like chemotaxis protein